MDSVRKEYETQIAELRDCMERMRAALKKEREISADLEQEVLILEKQLKNQQSNGNVGSEKEAYYQNQIAQYATSFSWKVTKPIRWFGRIVRKILGKDSLR